MHHETPATPQTTDLSDPFSAAHKRLRPKRLKINSNDKFKNNRNRNRNFIMSATAFTILKKHPYHHALSMRVCEHIA
ncbi:MAG: hypothetical protein Q7T62_05940 [Undibacterium sp.]|nr:hypothetical protein [Undibacterium sp.]